MSTFPSQVPATANFDHLKLDCRSLNAILPPWLSRITSHVTKPNENRMTLQEICSDVRSFIATPDPKRDAFDALARRLFTFQFEYNAPYRQFCNARGVTPQSLSSITDIPAIITTAFKQLDLSVLPASDRTTTFHSSGTTAHQPSRHFHSTQTLRIYEQSLLTWFQPHVCPSAKSSEPRNFLILSPRSTEAPHSSLVHMFETVSAKFGTSTTFAGKISEDGSWLLNFAQINQVQQLPTVICGTAFSFVHLCDHLASLNTTLTFPPGSRVFETGGYKGRSRTIAKPELHQLISHRLNIPESHIITEYGMSELSSQAYDRTVGSTSARIFHFPHWARASVISPETGREVADGETGLLRVLDLANVGSVAAIQTEDLAIRRDNGFNGFELIGRAPVAEPRGCSLMEVAS
jgi:hypothetical protein